MKQILNKYLSLLFFIGFIVNTSYAGGKESESSNLMMASDYYGSYSISLGQLDWNKNTNTASNEPMCKLTSIDNAWFLKLSLSEIKIKWEDELIGKNSVIPWIKDKINISIT